MARYIIFQKTTTYQYKFKGSAEGKNGNDAIQNLRKRSRLSVTSPYIAIPSKTFMKYQLNPTSTRLKKSYKVETTWKRPR